MNIKELGDAYHTLGLPYGASNKEVKDSYHKLASKYGQDKEGEYINKFVDITKAYKLISNLSDVDKKTIENEERDLKEKLIYPKQVEEANRVVAEKIRESIVQANQQKQKQSRHESNMYLLSILWCVLLIPLSIVLWNVHPVLGIISLALFFFSVYKVFAD